MRVLVVVPTFNEADNIERLLRTVHQALPEAGMLVVDDGSPDGTAGLVEGLATELTDLHVLRRTKKSGLGSAYRAGFAWGLARGYEACVEIDADFSHDPAALPELVAPLAEGYELVIGSRYVPGGSIPDWKFHRHLISWGGNRYATVALGLGVADSTAGFRAYAASVLRRLDLGAIRAEGYGFQIEMTYRTKQAGGTIAEVPIRFVDRVAGQSKMSSTIVVEAFGLVTLWGLARLWRSLFRRPAGLRAVGSDGGGDVGSGGGGDVGSDGGGAVASDGGGGSVGESPVVRRQAGAVTRAPGE
ncbi:MAG: polyprenol monophosphomannose synthase [Acidimicrobiales bacterium]